MTSSELRQIHPITRRDAADNLRVYYQDHLLGVVAQVRVPNERGRMCTRWQARLTALAEPMPELYPSKVAAMAALLTARTEGE
jgi:hypothetical protein